MKCSNCGAEINGDLQKCPYCECEVIPEEKAQPQTTITNNYYGGAPKTEETKTTCPRCGGNRIQFKREEVGTEKGKKKKHVLYRTVGICQDCGNTWEADDAGKKKKRGLWFWILAILFWPVSISIWFYKTERIKLDKKIKLAIIAAFWALIIILGAVSPDPETTALPADESLTTAVQAAAVDETDITNEDTGNKAAASDTTTKKNTETTAAPRPTTTKAAASIGKQNALASAKSYLRFSAFSYKGLMEQLEFEGYSADEAAYGVDNCGADWNEQAAKKAQSYLDFSSFSRDGLIEQLEFEGFTHEQAVYGVTAVGY